MSRVVVRDRCVVRHSDSEREYAGWALQQAVRAAARGEFDWASTMVASALATDCSVERASGRDGVS